MEERSRTSLYIRNFIFGVEDSLVSTVGLLSGIVAAGSGKGVIILTGIILIFVEAFSMAVGSFLSDQSAEEYVHQRDLPLLKSFSGGFTMFVSYFVSGFVPLAPYIFFPSEQAFWISIGCSLVALFALGATGSIFSRVNAVKGGFQMAVIGGLAIGIGVLVGQFFKVG